MKGTSEEGTGQDMDGEREELSGVGIERRREGATEQGREGYFKECILLRRALTSMYHKPSHNAALAIETLVLQMKNSEQV